VNGAVRRAPEEVHAGEGEDDSGFLCGMRRHLFLC
jgi:hypothetical protein